jgi:hypothetical protein
MGRLEHASVREIPASQDAMNALARDTGGRALRNQNYFDQWVGKILDETSNYYLLAWRPDKDESDLPHFKNITVRVIGHPEYNVRLPRGFLSKKTAPAKPPAVTEAPVQPHRECKTHSPLSILDARFRLRFQPFSWTRPNMGRCLRVLCASQTIGFLM